MASKFSAAKKAVNSSVNALEKATKAGNKPAVRHATAQIAERTKNLNSIQKDLAANALSGADYRSLHGISGGFKQKVSAQAQATAKAAAQTAEATQQAASGAKSAERRAVTRNGREVNLVGPGEYNGTSYGRAGKYTQKKQILNSNEAINPKEKGGLFNAEPVMNFFKDGFNGIKDTATAYSRISKDMGKDAKMMDVGKKALKEVYTKENGTLDMKKIAGSYMVAAGGARIATGGGLYKNGNGQTDVVGIPLI